MENNQLSTGNLVIPQPLSYGIPIEDYQNLTKLDLSSHQRVKQNLTYIPWGVSIQVMKSYDSSLDIRIEESEEGNLYFGNSEIGYYIKAHLTRDGERISESLVHAVRDYRNKAVKELDITHVTNSIQRATAKCVAINTGIGMSLYSQIDESIDAIRSDGSVIAEKTFLTWKSPDDAMKWAMSQGITEEEANQVMKEAEPDSKGRKSPSFFYKVKELAESKK